MNGIVAILTDQQTRRSLGADNGADIIAEKRAGHRGTTLYREIILEHGRRKSCFPRSQNLDNPRSITLASLWPKSGVAVISAAISTSLSLPPRRS